MKPLSWLPWCLAFVSVMNAASAPAKDVTSSIGHEPGAGMIMRHTFTADAAPAKVWAAIASSEGLGRWAAPAARVELKIGGSYELYFKPDNPPGKRGMEGNKVLSFSPERMISYSGGLPDTWVVYSIEKLENGTRVTFAAMGTNPEWVSKCSEQSGAVTAFVQKLADYLKR